MLASLLGAGGTVVGGESTSRAQLPLLLNQIVTQGQLTLAWLAPNTMHGVDLVPSWSSTSAQLPLLLNQKVTIGQTINTGLLSPASNMHGVDLVGAGTAVIDIGHIASTRVRDVALPAGGFVFVATNAPMIEVSLDLDNPTNPERSWTDITPWVRAIQITRGGRNHELQRSESGTMTLTLDNRDGRFDPDNANTPLPLGGLKRMQWVRVRALWGSATYDRSVMLVESIRQEWPGGSNDAVVTLRCVDAMKTLSLYDLAGQVMAGETTGERVASVCELVGLDVAAETGQSIVHEVIEAFPEETSAVSHLRAVEETENGQLFVDASGTVVFHDRHHRALDFTTAGVVGDTDGEIPYQTAALDMDDASIWNSVKVTTAINETREATDSASVARYYERRLNRELLSADPNEAQACAEYLLLLYADPPARLPAIELIGQSDTTQWPTILGLGNSDRLTWRIRPATESGNRTIEKYVIVERVSETIVPGGRWQTVIDVSPADPFDLWVLGDADRGVLGTTTRMGY